MSRMLRLARLAAPAAISALALTAAAAPAATPLHATSFVRGKPAIANQYPGPVAAIVGDVNGDGKDDTAFANNTEITVLFGAAPTADADLGADLGARGVRISSGTWGPIKDVAAAGDFDRDGIDDLILSTDTVAFVVYGSRSLPSSQTLGGGNARVTVLTGRGRNDTNDDVSSAGDFDGDGYDDVIVERGSIGAAIVSGGPRVPYIAANTQAARVSHVMAQQRCGVVWFTYACVYLGVKFQPLGDVDGDGLDDLGLMNTNVNTSVILWGRTGRFTTSVLAGSGKTTLPTPAVGQFPASLAYVAPAGDVNGDGFADFTWWDSQIFLGSRTRPSSLAASSPSIKLTTAGASQVVAVPAGDQNGDGIGDLVATTPDAKPAAYRVVSGLPKTAPATVNIDSSPAITGLTLSTGYLPTSSATGDLDGDGLTDLVLQTSGEAESAYLVTHGSSVPGGGGRPATLEAYTDLGDAVGGPIDAKFTLRTSCNGTTISTVTMDQGTSTPLASGLTEGDGCTVTIVDATPTNAAAYATCTWVDSATLNYTTQVEPAGSSFALEPGKNTYRLSRRCQLPPTAFPTSFRQAGWVESGHMWFDSSTETINVGDGPDQVSSFMYDYPLDWRNRTVEFTGSMSGGNLGVGTSEGITLAFVAAGADGKPSGGRIGSGGAQLGFGGLGGVAVAFDTKQEAGDPSSNFVGLTDGASGSGLHWLQTAPAVTALHSSGNHTFKVVNKAGRTTVYVDGTARLAGNLTIPASSYIAFTASTGADYQYQYVYLFKSSAS